MKIKVVAYRYEKFLNFKVIITKIDYISRGISNFFKKTYYLMDDNN